MRRVAIAGVLAMEPEVLVLDEPTAGLDPQGRKEMMEMFNQLHEEQQITIVLVTHLMEDVAEYADHIVILEQGTVVKEGAPEIIFQDEPWLESKQLDVPAAVSFATRLEKKTGIHLGDLPLTTDILADEIVAALRGSESSQEEAISFEGGDVK